MPRRSNPAKSMTARVEALSKRLDELRVEVDELLTESAGELEEASDLMSDAAKSVAGIVKRLQLGWAKFEKNSESLSSDLEELGVDVADLEQAAE